MPCSPATVAVTASGEGRQVMTVSETRAVSAAEPAHEAPASRSAVAASRLMSWTVAGKPARSRLPASKLGVTPFDLSDPVVMTDVRNEYGFGRIHSYAISQLWQANQIEAKFNIARVLDVPVNCVERFKERTTPSGGAR